MRTNNREVVLVLLAVCGALGAGSALMWWRGVPQYVAGIDTPVSLRVTGCTADPRQRSILLTLVVSNESTTRLCLPCPRDASSAVERLGWVIYIARCAPDGRGERTHTSEHGRLSGLGCDDLRTVEPGASIAFTVNLFGLPPNTPGLYTRNWDPKRRFGMSAGTFSVSVSYGMFGERGPYGAPAPFYLGPLQSQKFRIDIPAGMADDDVTNGEGGARRRN